MSKFVIHAIFVCAGLLSLSISAARAENADPQSAKRDALRRLFQEASDAGNEAKMREILAELVRMDLPQPANFSHAGPVRTNKGADEDHPQDLVEWLLQGDLPEHKAKEAVAALLSYLTATNVSAAKKEEAARRARDVLGRLPTPERETARSAIQEFLELRARLRAALQWGDPGDLKNRGLVHWGDGNVYDPRWGRILDRIDLVGARANVAGALGLDPSYTRQHWQENVLPHFQRLVESADAHRMTSGLEPDRGAFQAKVYQDCLREIHNKMRDLLGGALMEERGIQLPVERLRELSGAFNLVHQRITGEKNQHNLEQRKSVESTQAQLRAVRDFSREFVNAFAKLTPAGKAVQIPMNALMSLAESKERGDDLQASLLRASLASAMSAFGERKGAAAELARQSAFALADSVAAAYDQARAGATPEEIRQDAFNRFLLSMGKRMPNVGMMGKDPTVRVAKWLFNASYETLAKPHLEAMMGKPKGGSRSITTSD